MHPRYDMLGGSYQKYFNKTLMIDLWHHIAKHGRGDTLKNVQTILFGYSNMWNCIFSLFPKENMSRDDFAIYQTLHILCQIVALRRYCIKCKIKCDECAIRLYCTENTVFSFGIFSFIVANLSNGIPFCVTWLVADTIWQGRRRLATTRRYQCRWIDGLRSEGNRAN